MKAADHKQHAKDLVTRAIACHDKGTRNKLWELAKQHLESYYELIAEGKE
jgi:hypothetical protein